MRSLGRDDGWKNHGWHHLMMRCLFFTFFGSPKSNIWKYVRNMEMWLGSSEIFPSFTKFPFIASQRQSHGCVPCKWWSASEWRPQHQPEEFFQGYTMTCLNFRYSLWSSWGDVHAKYHKVMSFCNTVFNSQAFFSNSARIIISRYQNHQARQLEALCQEHLLGEGDT